MSREPLSLDSAPNTLRNLSSKSAQDKEVQQIEGAAKQHGFTPREYKSNSDIYTHQFNSRCRAVIKDIVADIAYHARMKKQDILDLAILAFLEKYNMKDLIDKYQRAEQ
tara:strand:- start:260 stop:586 length:327 start_codon:yes stop_codon:yes gene_type:complete